MAVRVVVYDSALARMHQPGGMVNDYVRDMAKQAKRVMEVIVPGQGRGTGRLGRSHHYRVRPRVSSTVGYVYNDAPHALFVHNGTGLYGPYHARIPGPHRFEYTRPPLRKGPGMPRYTDGQRAKPWMADAIEIVGRAHGLV
jgi:hypothetical protein